MHHRNLTPSVHLRAVQISCGAQRRHTSPPVGCNDSLGAANVRDRAGGGAWQDGEKRGDNGQEIRDPG